MDGGCISCRGVESGDFKGRCLCVFRLVGRAWRYCRRDEVLQAYVETGEVLFTSEEEQITGNMYDRPMSMPEMLQLSGDSLKTTLKEQAIILDEAAEGVQEGPVSLLADKVKGGAFMPLLVVQRRRRNLLLLSVFGRPTGARLPLQHLTSPVRATHAQVAVIFDVDGTLADTEVVAMEVNYWTLVPYMPSVGAMGLEAQALTPEARDAFEEENAGKNFEVLLAEVQTSSPSIPMVPLGPSSVAGWPTSTPLSPCSNPGGGRQGGRRSPSCRRDPRSPGRGPRCAPARR